MTQQPIIYVEWIDSHAIGSRLWSDKDEIEGVVSEQGFGAVSSAGFLVEENDEFILIAQCVSESQYGASLAIPKRCITRRAQLECEL